MLGLGDWIPVFNRVQKTEVDHLTVFSCVSLTEKDGRRTMSNQLVIALETVEYRREPAQCSPLGSAAPRLALAKPPRNSVSCPRESMIDERTEN